MPPLTSLCFLVAARRPCGALGLSCKFVMWQPNLCAIRTSEMGFSLSIYLGDTEFFPRQLSPSMAR